jgi:hypothetical protein
MWLAPPPGLLPSSHNPTIEPASIAISAIFAILALIILAVFSSKKNKGNYLDDTSESTQPNKRLMITGPLDNVLGRNGVAAQSIPRLWSGFSSSNEEIRRIGPVDRDGETAATATASRRAFELANAPARVPNTYHNAALPYPPYPVELDVLPSSPQQIRHTSTYNVRSPPSPIPQQDVKINNNSNAHVQPSPTYPVHRHLRSDFGDDTTVVGEKAEVETLRSDITFPDTDSDSASYDQGRWKLMDNKDVGLVGRHWE